MFVSEHSVVLFPFVLGLVSSVLGQEIGREERLHNTVFCVTWNVKPLLSQLQYIGVTIDLYSALS